MAQRLLMKQANTLMKSFLPGKGSTLTGISSKQYSLRIPLHGSLVAFSALFSAVTPKEYGKRNYANNLSEYNTVFGSIMAQRRHYLLRDGYEDMMLDGIQPNRDTFYTLILGAMMGARLQDGVYFMDEMKSMGLVPDAAIYNFIIGTCARTKNAEYAMQVLEEMKRHKVKLRAQTYVALLSACASCGQVDQAYTIVRDMTAAGLGLNKFCYASLIIAYKNKKPVTEETMKKIIDLVEQSKGWSSEASDSSLDPGMINVSEEELYYMPSAEYINRRAAFLRKDLTVYHTALHACADLGSKESIEMIMGIMKRENRQPDIYCITQCLRCYLMCKDFSGARKTFEDYLNSGKPHAHELYTTMIHGAMLGYAPEGMELAQDVMQKMVARGWYLNSRIGGELLLAASKEPFGGYTLANYIWDTMQASGIQIPLNAIVAYYNGLKEREIPEDDPRLAKVTQVKSSLEQRVFRGRTM